MFNAMLLSADVLLDSKEILCMAVLEKQNQNVLTTMNAPWTMPAFLMCAETLVMFKNRVEFKLFAKLSITVQLVHVLMDG